MELQPSARCPALQYLDDVDKGGVADMAGLRKGDYLLAVSIILSQKNDINKMIHYYLFCFIYSNNRVHEYQKKYIH